MQQYEITQDCRIAFRGMIFQTRQRNDVKAMIKTEINCFSSEYVFVLYCKTLTFKKKKKTPQFKCQFALRENKNWKHDAHWYRFCTNSV